TEGSQNLSPRNGCEQGLSRKSSWRLLPIGDLSSPRPMSAPSIHVRYSPETAGTGVGGAAGPRHVTHPPNPGGPLRVRPERPRCCAADQRDELAPLHSITSSARASSIGGISKPRRLAVLRLITNSNFVDWITGRSAGLAPLRMRPVLMPISW